MYCHFEPSERDHWETFAVSLCTTRVGATVLIRQGGWISPVGGPLVNAAIDFGPDAR